MTAIAIDNETTDTDASTHLPARCVLLVDRDERAGALLGNYLEARGWQVSHVSDPRRVLRTCAKGAVQPPILVVKLEETDTDGFELLAALAARTIAARTVVCAPGWIEGLALLGVERVLASPCRFSHLASTLEEVRQGFAERRPR
jgi:ActR/RegA family two-component response regulator